MIPERTTQTKRGEGMSKVNYIKKTGCFRDAECTCECGNKHQHYGGKGYTTTYLNGYSDGKVDGGVYEHHVSCKVCGAKSELKY